MGDLSVRFWGVRGSFPAPGPDFARYGGNTPCVQLEMPEGSLILDAGTGIVRLGRALSGADPLHLFLSHLHWDHIQGLPFFAPLCQESTRIRIYSAREPEDVRAALRMQMRHPVFPVAFDELDARIEFVRLPAGGLSVAGAEITPIPLKHPGGASGLRIEAAGRTIVYASDHEAGDALSDSALVDASRGAAALIMDAQYLPEERPDWSGRGHSSWADAIELATAADVDRLLLFHHDPWRSDEQLDDIQARARQRLPSAAAAAEGTVLRF